MVFHLSFLSSLLLSQHGLLRTLQKAMSLPLKVLCKQNARKSALLKAYKVAVPWLDLCHMLIEQRGCVP